jgi:hypothetical protein
MFNGCLGAGNEDAIIVLPGNVPTQYKRLLKSGQGKRFKEIVKKNINDIIYLPSRNYTGINWSKAAFIDGWWYYSYFDRIYKTKDFTQVTEIAQTIPYLSVSSSYGMLESFITNYGETLFVSTLYRLNYAGNPPFLIFVHRSTDLGVTWDRVLNLNFPSNINYDLLISSEYLLLSTGSWGDNSNGQGSNVYGRYRGYPIGAFGNEDSNGDGYLSGPNNVSANAGGLFVESEGFWYFAHAYVFNRVARAGFAGGGGAYPFVNMVVPNQLAYCPILNMVAIAGYKYLANSSTPQLAIEYWKIGVGGMYAATVPEALGNPQNARHACIAALPRGGFLVGWNYGVPNNGTEMYGPLFHSEDGVTYTDVTPTDFSHANGTILSKPRRS